MSQGQAPGRSTGGLRRRRRHDLDRPQAALEELDGVAEGDFARLDDAGQHPALALDLGT